MLNYESKGKKKSTWKLILGSGGLVGLIALVILIIQAIPSIRDGVRWSVDMVDAPKNISEIKTELEQIKDEQSKNTTKIDEMHDSLRFIGQKLSVPVAFVKPNLRITNNLYYTDP